MPFPLEGIRVVDFSRVLAGPHCGKTLLDLGAEVIKLEPPGGDLSRRHSPATGRSPATTPSRTPASAT
jgi:crotonobetainyl-CoA:carnitine CoA-transferase CaiB-like acyl-CoA transferase